MSLAGWWFCTAKKGLKENEYKADRRKDKVGRRTDKAFRR